MHRANAFTSYNLTLARARAQHVPAARDRQNRHKTSLYLAILKILSIYKYLKLRS
jgi:hypothetical protein